MEDACGYDGQSPATFGARVSEAPPQETKKAKKRERDVQKALDMVHDPVRLFTRPFATEDPVAATKAREHIEEGGKEIAKAEEAGATVAKSEGKRKTKKSRSVKKDKAELAQTLGNFLTEECYVDLGDVTVDSLIGVCQSGSRTCSMRLKSRMEDVWVSRRVETRLLRPSASAWQCLASCMRVTDVG